MDDRLAGLLRYFSVSARVFHSGPLCGRIEYAAEGGYLHVLRTGQVTVRSPMHAPLTVSGPAVVFYPRAAAHVFITRDNEAVDLVCARIDLGSAGGNPLALALPPVICIGLDGLPRLGSTIDMLLLEALEPHCGHQAAIDRLSELLLIQLLRHLLDERLADTGLLAGLGDPRLAHALAAMHDAPARTWTLEALAREAGMSRARFARHFHDVVGETPLRYLAQWRVTVACTLLRKGKPVALVANEVGYGGPTALARAFRSVHGLSPRKWIQRERRSETALDV